MRKMRKKFEKDKSFVAIVLIIFLKMKIDAHDEYKI